MNLSKYLVISILSSICLISCNFGSKKQTPSNQDTTEGVPEVATTSTPSNTEHMETYVNSVYRYHISYPDKLLIPQGESDSGDGQVFLSKDETCELRVYRDTRDMLYDGSILKKVFREDVDSYEKDSLSTSELTADYFILEARNGDNTVHQKTFLRKDKLLVTALITYKTDKMEAYESFVTPIFASIH